MMPSRWFWNVAEAAVLLLAGAGCVVPPVNDDIIAATAQEVQEQAWIQVKELTTELSGLDADRNPGVAALVEDLNRLVATVDESAVPNFERIDPAQVTSRNSNFWRASLEMSKTDATLFVLEGMMLAAAGQVEAAADVLDFSRAGPLMDESLDRRVALQQRVIEAWRWTPPGVELVMTRGLPAEEQWEPIMKLQQLHPDSATTALAVLRMRCDLAGVELTPASTGQRMRDKILEKEPAAVATLKQYRPLWGALVTATGEAGDAARRVAEMLVPEPVGILNLSEDDFDRLVADLNRVGEADWVLRASRLQMARRGGSNQADQEVWRGLLPGLVGDEAATAMLADWENGRMTQVALHRSLAEPSTVNDRPVNPIVAGHYERARRGAQAILEHGAPAEREETSQLLRLAETAVLLGRFDEAQDALSRYALQAEEPVRVARQQLTLAMARGDAEGMAQAKKLVRRKDRRLIQTNFTVGNAEIMAGNYPAAAKAFARGFNNVDAEPRMRAFAALHAFGAARLAGEDRTKLVRDAQDQVEEDEWIHRLLGAVLGEVDREQLLAEALEGREYLAVGQTCEAYFALAFAPGQTAAGRRADLEACRETGMVGYIEYQFAGHWLNHPQ